jgi:alkylation response protein AidB-like acyl-CoA dehydrogenase
VPFDLDLTDEQRVLKETLREFAREVVRPAARDAEAAGSVSPDLRRQIHELGVTAPVNEDLSPGLPLDAVTHAVAVEELAWGDPGIAFAVFGSGAGVVALGVAGSDAQRSKYLPAFLESEPASAFVAIGERVAAGDLESLETSIDGPKAVGRKYGVVDADSANFGIAVGRDENGPAAVLFEGGYEIVEREDKLGLEAAPTYIVDFDGAGEALSSGPQLERAILGAKLLVGAIAVGSARAGLEYASQYAIERQAFGKPIGAFQGVSFKIADMAIAVDAARLAVWRAAWKLDRGDATLADVAEANGHALSAAILCGDDGVQILGGHGYIRDHPVEKWFRDAVTLSVFDSPDLAGDVMTSRSVFVG